MQLLASNAYNILWIGRYLARIHCLCRYMSIQDDQQAQRIAAAFYLPAYDASSLNALILDPEQLGSLNQLFHAVYDNIQSLRGVLSDIGYSELNALFQHAKNNAGYICDVVNEFDDILEGESEDLFLFFSLGQTIELLDQALRLKEPLDDLIVAMDHLVMVLQDYHWQKFEESWQAFKKDQDSNHFFEMTSHLQNIFEVTI